jgi:hypothetical protein
LRGACCVCCTLGACVLLGAIVLRIFGTAYFVLPLSLVCLRSCPCSLCVCVLALPLWCACAVLAGCCLRYGLPCAQCAWALLVCLPWACGGLLALCLRCAWYACSAQWHACGAWRACNGLEAPNGMLAALAVPGVPVTAWRCLLVVPACLQGLQCLVCLQYFQMPGVLGALTAPRCWLQLPGGLSGVFVVLVVSGGYLAVCLLCWIVPGVPTVPGVLTAPGSQRCACSACSA